MASLEVLLTAPVDFIVSGSASNGNATATAPAGAADEVIIVVGITLSASGTPAAGVAVALVTDTVGANRQLWVAQIPNAAFAPIDINFKNPLKGDMGKNVQMTLPALGAGITGTAVIRYFLKKA